MQKVSLGIIGALVLLGALYFFIKPANETKAPLKNGPIVAFGDSLVEGVGAGEGKDFVSVLSTRIGEPIINMGVSGNTTRDGLTRIDDVLAEDPRIVILLLGGNDYIRKIPQDETFSNLRTLITKIEESGAVVVLLGIRGGLLRDEFSDSFQALAEETQVVYVKNVLEGIFGKSALMADAIHPNEEGYKLIADKVYAKLEDVLMK